MSKPNPCMPLSALRHRLRTVVFLVAILGCMAPASFASNNNTEPIRLTQSELEYVERGQVRLVYNPAWPPFDYRDDSGHHAGLAADLLHLISDKSGLQMKTVPTSDWSETLDLIRSGDFDLVSLLNARTDAPEHIEYTTPILKEPLVLVAASSSGVVGLTSLTGPLALVQGYLPEASIRRGIPNIRIINADSTEETMQLVIDGEAHAALMTAIEARHLLAKERWKTLSVVSKTPYSYTLAIGVRKGDAPLLSIVQKSVEGITNEEMEKFITKWMADSPYSQNGLSAYWIWLIGGMLTVLIAIIVHRKCVSAGKCSGLSS